MDAFALEPPEERATAFREAAARIGGLATDYRKRLLGDMDIKALILAGRSPCQPNLQRWHITFKRFWRD